MSYTSNTNDAINDAEFFPALLADIADGGTLVAFCVEHEVHYKLVNRWINDDAERAKRYALALTIREEHAKDLIIAELTSYIKADVTVAFDEMGNLKRMQDMPKHVKRLIAGIKFREIFENEKDSESGKAVKVHVGNIIEVKFWDKPRSIETFMKHLAMLVDRKQHEVKFSLADLIAGEPTKPSTV